MRMIVPAARGCPLPRFAGTIAATSCELRNRDAEPSAHRQSRGLVVNGRLSSPAKSARRRQPLPPRHRLSDPLLRKFARLLSLLSDRGGVARDSHGKCRSDLIGGAYDDEDAESRTD